MRSHYEETLQRDTKVIQDKVMQMHKLADRALRDCVKALVERNRQLAYAIILRDQYIDELEKEIDRLCLEFLVRQQPVALHLRFAYATIKINLELERIGDYAESIARQILKISALEPPPSFDKYVAIANLSIPMLQQAVQSFIEQNPTLARGTMVTEEEVDVLRNGINAALMQQRQEGKIPMEAFTPLMTIARRFERVSDQAKNICEEVLYMCTGEYAKHKGTEILRVLFVDNSNSCRSQIAEGIANSLRRPEFLFSSAGVDPKPIDPRTASFLAEKRIDISRQASKSVDQVPNLDHYHVIVALAKEGQKVFPPPPTKTVALDWNVADPSLVQGSPEQIRAAYEQTFQYINSHIRDLVEAILGEKQNGEKKHV